jgi:hypothetical protein
MSQPESHPVRSGVIGTVIGGLILAALGYVWAPARALFGWLCGFLATTWAAVVAAYPVPGWLLILFGVLTISLLIRMISSFARGVSPAPLHLAYTEDEIFGARWHWAWKDNRITQLWSSCPKCQGELVYLNERDSFLLSAPQAKYFCEHCQKILVAIPGGGHDFAISAVEREIRRRLRISENQSNGDSK